MKFGLRLILILLLVGVAEFWTLGQPLTFNNVDFSSPYDVHPDSGYMAFLYKVRSHQAGSMFNLFLVNDDFRIRDSVQFKFPRYAQLIGQGSNSKYYYYAFYNQYHGKSIQFLITDHAGKLLSRYSKSRKELQSIFKTKVDPFECSIEFFRNSSETEVLIMKFSLIGNRMSFQQGILAMQVSDGKTQWGIDIPMKSDPIEFSDNRFIVMTYKANGRQDRKYTVNVFDKKNGHMINSFPLREVKEFQYLRTLKSNGSIFLLSGANYRNFKKEHNDFVEIVDPDGNVLLNHVSDTISFKHPGLGLVVGTSRFDDQGDLLLTGVLREPMNFDTVHFVTGGHFFGIDQNLRMLKETILGLVSYTISCDDGTVLDFNNYPPLLSYDNYRGSVYDSKHALLLFGKILWLFDLKNMVRKPVPFKLNSEHNAIFLNSSGPMAIFDDKLNNQIVFWRLVPEPKRTN